MRSRIIVAVIGLPLLILLLLAGPAWALAAVVAAVSALMLWEFWAAAVDKGHEALKWFSLPFTLLPPILCLFGIKAWWPLYLYVFFCAVYGIVYYEKKAECCLDTLCKAFLPALILPMFLNSILRLALEENGRLLSLLVFVIAFGSDSGAFFAGKAFGKHKLSPRVSPNKTAEGAVGGFAAGVVMSVLFGILMNAVSGKETALWQFAVYGCAGNLASQIGDLFFSFIKRGRGIKDFGKLLPGHGGMLDRLDSVLFAAPVLELLIDIFPL